MQDAPEKEWTVKALAEMVGWTENHYSFRFRQVMGVSPLQYLIRHRLELASEMLKSSSLRISEVAYKVGFNSMNYFSQRFRQAYGMVPREYREKHGDSPQRR
jgi:transcriptional regulator GlxA family with amidase domain